MPNKAFTLFDPCYILSFVYKWVTFLNVTKLVGTQDLVNRKEIL